MVRAQVERRPLEEVEPVVEIREILEARELVRAVQVHDEVLAYAVALAEATRDHPAVSLGVSPRGSIALVRVAQARAATRAPRLRGARGRQGACARGPGAQALGARRYVGGDGRDGAAGDPRLRTAPGVGNGRSIAKPALVVSLGLVLYLIASNVGAGWLYVVVAALLGWCWSPSPCRGSACAASGSRGAPLSWPPPANPSSAPWSWRTRAASPGSCSRCEDRFAGDTGRAVAVRVRRGETETVGYTVENPRRGIYAGGEIVVESRAPFGLFYGRRRMRAASETVVYPRTFDVAGLPPAADTDAERGTGASPRRCTGATGASSGASGITVRGTPPAWSPGRGAPAACPRGSSPSSSWPRETHPPFVLAMNLDAGAPAEAREMVVSAGASLLLYALGEGREVNADAGPDNAPFPEEPTPDSVLTWCAGLRASRPPDHGRGQRRDTPIHKEAGHREGHGSVRAPGPPRCGPSCSYRATSSRGQGPGCRREKSRSSCKA